eukprot:9804517-Alexandrium_andersonii.AAC.1
MRPAATPGTRTATREGATPRTGARSTARANPLGSAVGVDPGLLATGRLPWPAQGSTTRTAAPSTTGRRKGSASEATRT